MTTETVEQNTTESKPKRNISPEAKKASSLRRDAAMLERLAAGSSDPKSMLEQAAALKAQADVLAPATAQKPKAEPRPFCAYIYTETVTGKDGVPIHLAGSQCGAKASKGSQYCYSHTDPLSKLSEPEWNAVEGYFLADIRPRLLDGFSVRDLKQIAAEQIEA